MSDLQALLEQAAVYEMSVALLARMVRRRDATIAAMKRPAPPYPAPARYRWEAGPAGDERELDDAPGYRCRQPRCGNRPVVILWRRHGRGERRPWRYCAEHLCGRWVEGGQILAWRLRLLPEFTDAG